MELGRRSSQHAFLYLKLSEGVSGFDPVVASALPVDEPPCGPNGAEEGACPCGQD
jgi:hypothetical protein